MELIKAGKMSVRNELLTEPTREIKRPMLGMAAARTTKITSTFYYEGDFNWVKPKVTSWSNEN